MYKSKLLCKEVITYQVPSLAAFATCRIIESGLYKYFSDCEKRIALIASQNTEVVVIGGSPPDNHIFAAKQIERSSGDRCMAWFVHGDVDACWPEVDIKVVHESEVSTYGRDIQRFSCKRKLFE